nr:hypothetical protein [Aliiruegeria lutimaris]
MPAFDAKQFGHLAVAVPAMAFCQPDHGQLQRFVVPFDGQVLHRAINLQVRRSDAENLWRV